MPLQFNNSKLGCSCLVLANRLFGDGLGYVGKRGSLSVSLPFALLAFQVGTSCVCIAGQIPDSAFAVLRGPSLNHGYEMGHIAALKFLFIYSLEILSSFFLSHPTSHNSLAI